MANRKEAQSLTNEIAVTIQTAGLMNAFPLAKDHFIGSNRKSQNWAVWRVALLGRKTSEIQFAEMLRKVVH